MPKRNMDDVMGLSVGSFAEDEACSWIKSTVRQWRDDDAGALECYLGCLPLAIGLASTHAGVHGTASPAEFLAALKRVAPPQEQLEVGAKVELHSLNATEHNGKHGELLEYDAEAQRWAVELSKGGRKSVRTEPGDLLSSTERKAVLVLKQHALVTVDDKDLGAIHSLT